MADSIKLSIITVVYNDIHRFIPTFENICRTINRSNHKDEVEYIVKDGDSTDHIIEYVKRYDKLPKYFEIYSRKDDGIYSGMNQAIQISSGEYLLFINAGDRLLPNSLSIILRYLGEGEILAFDFQIGNKICSPDKIKGLFLYRSPCHQAMVTKRDITYFSEEYELASDYKFFLEKRKLINHINEPISVFDDEIKNRSYQQKIISEKINILFKADLKLIKKLISILYLRIIQKWDTYFIF